jgi:hypothetical protein
MPPPLVIVKSAPEASVHRLADHLGQIRLLGPDVLASSFKLDRHVRDDDAHLCIKLLVHVVDVCTHFGIIRNLGDTERLGKSGSGRIQNLGSRNQHRSHGSDLVILHMNLYDADVLQVLASLHDQGIIDLQSLRQNGVAVSIDEQVDAFSFSQISLLERPRHHRDPDRNGENQHEFDSLLTSGNDRHGHQRIRKNGRNDESHTSVFWIGLVFVSGGVDR